MTDAVRPAVAKAAYQQLGQMPTNWIRFGRRSFMIAALNRRTPSTVGYRLACDRPLLVLPWDRESRQQLACELDRQEDLAWIEGRFAEADRLACRAAYFPEPGR